VGEELDWIGMGWEGKASRRRGARELYSQLRRMMEMCLNKSCNVIRGVGLDYTIDRLFRLFSTLAHLRRRYTMKI
jgi:hypothetical protein